MGSKPKNLSEAIDQLEDQGNADGLAKAADELQAQLKNQLRHIEETLAKLRPHLDDIPGRVSAEAKKAKDTVEAEVQKNPWAAIGLAAFFAFIVGFLFATTRRKD